MGQRKIESVLFYQFSHIKHINKSKMKERKENNLLLVRRAEKCDNGSDSLTITVKNLL